MINLLFWLGLIINESVSISIVVMLNRLESIQLLLAGIYSECKQYLYLKYY